MVANYESGLLHVAIFGLPQKNCITNMLFVEVQVEEHAYLFSLTNSIR
jgi:hypothetical protein